MSKIGATVRKWEKKQQKASLAQLFANLENQAEFLCQWERCYNGIMFFNFG